MVQPLFHSIWNIIVSNLPQWDIPLFVKMSEKVMAPYGKLSPLTVWLVFFGNECFRFSNLMMRQGLCCAVMISKSTNTSPNYISFIHRFSTKCNTCVKLCLLFIHIISEFFVLCITQWWPHVSLSLAQTAYFWMNEK